eukprot:gene7246-9655_t
MRFSNAYSASEECFMATDFSTLTEAMADEAPVNAVRGAASVAHTEPVVFNADRHLVQPWPEAGEIGAEARTLLASGDGCYVIGADGRQLLDGPAGMW